MVMNLPIKIQSYKGTFNGYVMPIATYDVILGVPLHEQHDAVTHHYKREVHIHHDNKQHILKHARCIITSLGQW